MSNNRMMIADFSDHGWLRLTGRDRLDFLQRLSTNDLRRLTPGQGLPTVLASGVGRVMALLVAYVGADALYLRTSPGQAAGVRRYLTSMIFWNDQVEVSAPGDESTHVAQFALFGPDADTTIAGLAGLSLDALPTNPGGWRPAEIAGTPITLHRGGPLEVQQWTVVVPAAHAAAVRTALIADAALLDIAAVELLRVEAGIPAWGRELNDQVTPLEAGLIEAVSFNKGCYTGQEVIARQANYDKITRRLVGLILPGGAADLSPNAFTGAPVRAGSGKPGFVGTVVWSAAREAWLALAVVPRDAAAPGNRVTITLAGDTLTATTAALPFIE
jgi:tRNA-modifying protein YgfZ